MNTASVKPPAKPPTSSPITLTQFSPVYPAQIWRYSAAMPNKIEALGSQAVMASGSTLTAAPQSITLWVIPGR